MRPRISIPLTALVLLALLQAHRILLASVILDAAAALAAPVRPLALLAALIRLAILVLPALRLPLERDRQVTLAAAAAIVGIARAGAALPQSHFAGLAAAVTLAAAAIYLGAGVGLLARRTVAGGAALAMAADITLRWLAAPGPHAVRLGIPLLLAAALLALAVLSLRSTVRPAEGMERRAGGLRLRGALALGAILFLETSALASPASSAASAGLDLRLLAPALAVTAAGAAIWLMAGGGPARLYRPRLVVMGAIAGAAALLVGSVRGVVSGLLLVAGHLCALLLLGRALAPASGRRGTWTAAGALALLAAFDGALAVASAAHAGRGGAVPWVQVLAALVLTANLALIPRPMPAEPLL